MVGVVAKGLELGEGLRRMANTRQNREREREKQCVSGRLRKLIRAVCDTVDGNGATESH